MRFEREIRHLSLGLLLAFLVVAGSAAYWAALGEETILRREDNPRLVLAEAAIRRGTIYDRNFEALVQSVVDERGRVQRVSLHEETHGALGYFSLRYGVDGVESAFNTFLRGDHQPVDLTRRIERDLLHRPRVGSDLLLSLDLNLQQRLADAMAGQQGAAIVLSVPDGKILAMVSLPTYNPNELDLNWDELIAASGKPFFNRVLQGTYQPGGAVQIPILAAASMRGIPRDAFIAGAGLPVQVDNLTLSCVAVPPEVDLTIQQALAYGCPNAFLILAQELGERAMGSLFSTLQLNTPLSLTGQPIRASTPATIATETAVPEATSEAVVVDYTKRYLGQGEETINPLRMALLSASLINGGSVPEPSILLARRDPGSEWVYVTDLPATIPLLTNEAARRMRDALVQNVGEGPTQAAQRDGLTIGGHSALAYSGEETQAWFVGFVSLANNQGAAVVIILENSADAPLAARIGGDGLEAAASILGS